MSSFALARASVAQRRPILASISNQVVSAAAGKRLPAAALASSIAPYAKDAIYISEGDYNPQFVSAPFPPGVPFDAKAIVRLLAPVLGMFDKGALQPLAKNTFEVSSAKDAASFMDGLSEVEPDAEPEYKTSAAAFAKIVGLLKGSLSDLTVLKYGPKDKDGELATDQGLYVYLIAGRSIDGKVCGVAIGTVET